MQQGFWKNLKRPIYALAPMANVTDAAFRRLIAKYGKPDITWTEFVSVDGLMSEEGRKRLLVDFWYTEGERPIVAQIFGSKPDHFYEAAKLINKLGFDGIDINMGCPDKAVEKTGSGAALIKNFENAKEIIFATQKGSGGLPVSVKTRIGYNSIITEEWITNLMEAEPVAITIHGRTRKEMSLVPAHWDEIAKGVQVAKSINSEVIVLGNGDVQNLDQADQRIKESGVDGVMIGRGIFGNPWLFNRSKDVLTLDPQEKLKVMVEHTLLFEQLFPGHKHFDVMKKHYKAYVTGWDGSKELRIKLFETKNAREVEGIVSQYLQTNP